MTRYTNVHISVLIIVFFFFIFIWFFATNEYYIGELAFDKQISQLRKELIRIVRVYIQLTFLYSRKQTLMWSRVYLSLVNGNLLSDCKSFKLACSPLVLVEVALLLSILDLFSFLYSSLISAHLFSADLFV